ncbi:hypothetical protein LTR84_008048 [Exophiala bonariae]|uniref:polynucleotide adenylyltransferase n=1 Tax=Exophiala bonariae TaxID=1690606 RepID=A0AAV9NQC6_9EURO|nr:hypothetical protein LTR84_008048 [Exophiala bonariae]
MERGSGIIHRSVPVQITQSKSMPSTPFQRPQSRSDLRNSPSPDQPLKHGSPRSQPSSDRSHTPPTVRKRYGGCKYETGMARARRRVPYSLGPEPLDKDKGDLKSRLTHEEDEKLTKQMTQLYQDLQPTPESEERRSNFIAKLKRILLARWPNSSITVNVFGSTGNNLGTSDSDVDICITTDCKELEHVCSIAELLANNGMERVVCVSSAKVPIVKVWDPELQVACDINVNNPLALENTEMVRTYVAIDSRVRPLAMIIKYWAKRRILNDAGRSQFTPIQMSCTDTPIALGGTLSSYTWICLALNFLQTRDPPVLPALQQAALEPKLLAGVNVSFDRDTANYENFGARSKSSLGELLFHFFRYYGHELDFEHNVVSVRLGKVLPKVEKSWHLLQDNRLCVEEPFNISRNLANTADDTSMRGIHLELRRAFDLLGQGKLDASCEQFVHAPEEIKPSDIFVPPSSRPVIPQAPTQPSRGGRNGARGGRHASHTNRNVNGRRSSNPSGRASTYLRNLPFQMTTQELQAQQQHQQHLLHDQLFQQYQYLQLQEQELRMQLHQRELRQRGLLGSGYTQVTGYPSFVSHEDGLDATSGQINGVGRAPLSAPLYQQRFTPQSPYLMASHSSQGVATDPPSPRVNTVYPDSRRFSRRTSLTQSATGGSLRAHSQPARVMPISSLQQFHSRPDVPGFHDSLVGRRSSASSTSHEHVAGGVEHAFGLSGSMHDAGRRPAEYLGYYVGQSPSLSAYTQSTTISPIPSHAGLAIQNGGLSPRLASAAIRASQAPQGPSSQSASNDSMQTTGGDSQANQNEHSAVEVEKPRTGPLVVDGSINSPRRRRQNHLAHDLDEQMNLSASTSEDFAFDTPSSSDEQSQDALDFTARERSPSHSPRAIQLKVGQKSIANGVPVGHPPLQEPIKLGEDLSGVEGRIDSDALTGIGLSRLTINGAWPLDRKLSSVEEVRTPSPKVEGYRSMSDSPETTARPTSPLLRGEGTFHGQDKVLGPRTNGTLPTYGLALSSGNNINSNSAWQTQKKKKKNKKVVKPVTETQGLNNSGGETPPENESLRKGG